MHHCKYIFTYYLRDFVQDNFEYSQAIDKRTANSYQNKLGYGDGVQWEGNKRHSVHISQGSPGIQTWKSCHLLEDVAGAQALPRLPGKSKGQGDGLGGW